MPFTSSIPLSQIRASNALIGSPTSSSGPSYAPRVAVFVGATSGIGKATLSLLVSKGTPLRAYVVGRSESAQRAFLDELRAANPKAEIVFLEAQVSLMAETRRVCDEIAQRESEVDLLFMSAGYLPFGGRDETSEGLEPATALAYYGRMLFALRLLPLLEAAALTTPAGGPGPRVVTILAAGLETAEVPLDDLDMRGGASTTTTTTTSAGGSGGAAQSFNVVSLAKLGATYTTLSFSRLAAEHPRVVFVHAHPGVVRTPIYKKGFVEGGGSGSGAAASSSSSVASSTGTGTGTTTGASTGTSGGGSFMRAVGKAAATLGTPLLALAGGISAEQAAERCAYLATSARYGANAAAAAAAADGVLGVPLAPGQKRGTTLAGRADGLGDAGLYFVVGHKMDSLTLDDVMAELRRKNAPEVVWARLMQVLAPYV